MFRKLLLTTAILCVAGGSVGQTAEAHILNPSHKSVSKMTLKQQLRYYRHNELHAKYTLQWFSSIRGNWSLDAKRYPAAFSVATKSIANHRWLLRDSKLHVKQIEARLAPHYSVVNVTTSVDSCLRQIIIYEGSGWNPHATNKYSGAYGLPQALPGSKMASAGSDWRDNPNTQIRWMIGYVNGRYGGSCNALTFWNAHRWY